MQCGFRFYTIFSQQRYCSQECSKIAIQISRYRNKEVRCIKAAFSQRLEWAPQKELTDSQIDQAQRIARYCVKSSLRYCQHLLASY